MTSFERKQKDVVFMNAGRKAARLGVFILDNPYKENPYRKLWTNGYKQEAKKIAKRKKVYIAYNEA